MRKPGTTVATRAENRAPLPKAETARLPDTRGTDPCFSPEVDDFSQSGRPNGWIAPHEGVAQVRVLLEGEHPRNGAEVAAILREHGRLAIEDLGPFIDPFAATTMMRERLISTHPTSTRELAVLVGRMYETKWEREAIGGPTARHVFETHTVAIAREFDAIAGACAGNPHAAIHLQRSLFQSHLMSLIIASGGTAAAARMMPGTALFDLARLQSEEGSRYRRLARLGAWTDAIVAEADVRMAQALREAARPPESEAGKEHETLVFGSQVRTLEVAGAPWHSFRDACAAADLSRGLQVKLRKARCSNDQARGHAESGPIRLKINYARQMLGSNDNGE